MRKWGRRSRYTIVEDGDRKGNTSGKGIKAKARAKIYAMTLPPRTPSLMPLDYAIWYRIITKVMEDAPEGKETKDQGRVLGAPPHHRDLIAEGIRQVRHWSHAGQRPGLGGL